MRAALAAALILLTWLAGAWLLPVVQDEAYYFSWARHLSLGYFDHPPLVALMDLGAIYAGGSPFLSRAGALVVAILTMLAAARFFRNVGLTGRRALATALLLAFGNLCGLVFGFIATPDTVLMLAWTLALGEAALAVRGDRKRWLTAGLAAGLGLWAKYIMLLMGLVFLWALVAEWRCARARAGDVPSPAPLPNPALPTPWPYVGGLLCLLVIAPHLWWNSQNDWITLRFQLRHGFAKEHLLLSSDSPLPIPEKPVLASTEVLLGAGFADLAEIEKKAEKKPRLGDTAIAALNRYLGYYGSQVGLWGGIGVALFLAWRRSRRLSGGDAVPVAYADGQLHAEAKPLVLAAAAVPLLVFGCVSLFSQVEANWSAMYVFGAAALLAPLLVGAPKALWGGTLANIALVAVGLAHAATGFLPTRPHRDRVLYETHGYKELATHLASVPGPLFADSYQLVAMISFHAPGLAVHQWPGITRDSEFVRPAELAGVDAAGVRRAGRFWLATTQAPPPHFPGFFADQMAQLRDCKGQALQVINAHQVGQGDVRCKQPIHEWFLVRYVTAETSE